MRLQNPHKQVSNRYPTGPTGIQRHIEYAPTIGRAYAREHRFRRTDLASPLAHGAQIKQVKPATDMSAPSTMNLGCSWRENRIGELGDRSDLSGETVEIRSRLIAAINYEYLFLLQGCRQVKRGNRSNQVFFRPHGWGRWIISAATWRRLDAAGAGGSVICSYWPSLMWTHLV